MPLEIQISLPWLKDALADEFLKSRSFTAQLAIPLNQKTSKLTFPDTVRVTVHDQLHRW